MRYRIFIIAALFVSLYSCTEDIDLWESPVKDFAGDWYVRYDHETYGEDPFGAGFNGLTTYNTAVDDGTEIWLTDEGHFWDYKVRIPVNVDGLTFGSETPVTNFVDGYEIEVVVKNGKVIKEAALLPSGVMADSIYFEVWFEDLEGATGIADDVLYVGGYRKTGFSEDEPH